MPGDPRKPLMTPGPEGQSSPGIPGGDPIPPRPEGATWDGKEKMWTPNGGTSTNVGYNPTTGRTGTPEGSTMTPGDIRDPFTYGGKSGEVYMTPGGDMVIDPSRSGRQRDVDRFREMGAGAANGQAPTLDYTKGNQDRAAAYQTRDQQNASIDALRGAARGDAPSGVEMRGRGALDQSFAGALAAGGGAKGGAGMAGYGANIGAMGRSNAGIAGAYGAQRSGELAEARGAFGTGAGEQRTGDLRAQHLSQDRNRVAMDNEIRQRELNQRGFMGFEDLAFGVNEAAQGMGLAKQELDAKISDTSTRRDIARDDKLASYYHDATTEIGNYGGGGKK